MLVLGRQNGTRCLFPKRVYVQLLHAATIPFTGVYSRETKHISKDIAVKCYSNNFSSPKVETKLMSNTR